MVYVDNQIDLLDWEDAMAQVSTQRRAHAMQYSHERDRCLSIAAYRLLQQGLSTEYHINEPPLFDFETTGKPRLAKYPNIYFNLSHCRSGRLCD